MAKQFPLIGGWEIGFSQDVVQAALERGGAGDAAVNVAFAYDAPEAAIFVRDALEKWSFEEEWEGTEQDLAFIKAFAYRY